MTLSDLLQALGEEVLDPEAESFLLFSQAMPSQDLGFIDPKAKFLDIVVAGKDMIIQQSPAILSSDRKNGTTGAVVWRITPLFANWIASDENILFRTSIVGPGSAALELGCGISGVVSLAVASKVRMYIATDQEYVFKTLKINIAQNMSRPRPAKRSKQHGGKSAVHSLPTASGNNIKIAALDWELSLISTIPHMLGLEPSDPSGDVDIDVILACDCIFNEPLVDPFVQTCVDLCCLTRSTLPKHPTLCVIAQQLRSHTVFEAWLLAFHSSFRVWRVPDHLLLEGLKQCSGFVIHIGLLRDARKTS